MLTIHGSSISPFVRKALVCLIEKGIDYELNPVGPFPAAESPLEISPPGKTPALTDGDLAILGSSAICGYLEKRFSRCPLYPGDTVGYGRALWYESWADSELPKATVSLFFNRVAMKMLEREPDEEATENIIHHVLVPFTYLDSAIGEKTYLLGDQLSIADIAVTCQFIQMQYAGEALPAVSHPNITRYVATHMRRNSFRSLINDEPFMRIS
ncbi:MAG: glutathione S-transferase family protein [Pseudomonadales bacterium]